MAFADLRSELTCPVCREIYTDPVTLSCGHTYCRVCIGRYWDWQEGIEEDLTCPECRHRYWRHPELNRNLRLHNVAELFLPTDPEQACSGIFCTYCDISVPVVKSCLHCEAYLCSHHLAKHSKSAKHILVDPTKPERKKCLIHGRNLELNCTEDGATICASCWLAGEHRGHRVKLLNETEREAQRLQERRREGAEVQPEVHLTGKKVPEQSRTAGWSPFEAKRSIKKYFRPFRQLWDKSKKLPGHKEWAAPSDEETKEKRSASPMPGPFSLVLPEMPHQLGAATKGSPWSESSPGETTKMEVQPEVHLTGKKVPEQSRTAGSSPFEAKRSIKKDFGPFRQLWDKSKKPLGHKEWAAPSDEETEEKRSAFRESFIPILPETSRQLKAATKGSPWSESSPGETTKMEKERWLDRQVHLLHRQVRHLQRKVRRRQQSALGFSPSFPNAPGAFGMGNTSAAMESERGRGENQQNGGTAAGLRDKLTCSICWEIYTDPVTLPCGHNCCLRCTEGTWGEQKEKREGRSCPECKHKIKIKMALSKNHSLCNIVQFLLPPPEQQDPAGTYCTYCIHSLVPAAKSCLLCEASLCDKHVRVHSQAAEHVLTVPTVLIGYSRCSAHQELLRYHCTDDQARVCVSCCMAGWHRGHRVEMFPEEQE